MIYIYLPVVIVFNVYLRNEWFAKSVKITILWRKLKINRSFGANDIKNFLKWKSENGQ